MHRHRRDLTWVPFCLRNARSLRASLSYRYAPNCLCFAIDVCANNYLFVTRETRLPPRLISPSSINQTGTSGVRLKLNTFVLTAPRVAHLLTDPQGFRPRTQRLDEVFEGCKQQTPQVRRELQTKVDILAPTRFGRFLHLGGRSSHF
jgi:hypothetical protein